MITISSKPADTSYKLKTGEKIVGPTRVGKTFSAARRGTENPP